MDSHVIDCWSGQQLRKRSLILHSNPLRNFYLCSSFGRERSEKNELQVRRRPYTHACGVVFFDRCKRADGIRQVIRCRAELARLPSAHTKQRLSLTRHTHSKGTPHVLFFYKKKLVLSIYVLPHKKYQYFMKS